MTTTTANPHATAPAAKMPPQIPYIIGNEGCERFSFYGMRNILTVFLMTSLLLAVPADLRKAEAKEVFHTFVIGVYFFPLLGGWLADRFFGKYPTILWFSLIYCAGHACLALFENSIPGFYTGLFLISLGSGGIKPLVSAFVGDQFDKGNRSLAQKVYDAFYWIINFGSFFASLFMPILLKEFGARVAFGVPGLLMFVATAILWSGRAKYVHAPARGANPHSFLKVVWTALKAGGTGAMVAALGVIGAGYSLGQIGGLGLVPAVCLALVLVMGFGGAGAAMQLDRARGAHPDAAVDGARAVLRLLVLFALVTPFWSLFDQKASTWVLQADQMSKPAWFQSSMMQALNPALVMILIPFNNLVLYPMLGRVGVKVTALRRMGFGIALAGVAWIFAGMLQLWIDAGDSVSIVWQMLPYVALTLGEVLVSATGLEFAYSQAPQAMKGTITSFWNLSVTIGNLWVLLSNVSVKSPSALAAIQSSGYSETACLMFFFAGFALVAAALFGLVARRYPMQDHYRA
ncbi:oligopeptide:H+ symporter [Roseateles saccharophilus]|uniref:POT family proton-dependent oligopeptide transporter n=1 Tax=Roseateles saccharophilus TaxID=304 RepID=A0A4R3UCJ5_ROSSA|nr:oligopeptide:H+ symporter [Roseateles saccharophilus]MDG0835762.1 MFS transporter [Roseateles saccharophilus]TCU84466.1 POT family proton-dependent oligopeptide transporter [Roseateles saccharophilus]